MSKQKMAVMDAAYVDVRWCFCCFFLCRCSVVVSGQFWHTNKQAKTRWQKHFYFHVVSGIRITCCGGCWNTLSAVIAWQLSPVIWSNAPHGQYINGDSGKDQLWSTASSARYAMTFHSMHCARCAPENLIETKQKNRMVSKHGKLFNNSNFSVSKDFDAVGKLLLISFCIFV